MSKIYAISDGDKCCGGKEGDRQWGMGAILQGVFRKGLTEKATFEPRLWTLRK